MTSNGGAPLTRREARVARTPAATRKALTKVAKRRNPGSAFVSFAALLAVGGLVVAVSVPAALFATDEASLASVTSTVVDVPEAATAQHISVDDNAAIVAPARDAFDTTSYAEQLALKYANYGGSFSATTGAIRWPFPYTVPITDGFGLRPANVSGQPMHNGVDFTPGGGTAIFAIADGVVSYHVEEQGGLGNNITIQHSIPGQNVESVYAHMQYGSSPLKVGDTVRVGDFIGLVGDTGNSYGAHLHFELHIDKVPVDPFAWLQANATN